MPAPKDPPPVASVWFGACGGTTSIFVNAADHETWSAALATEPAWLTLVAGATGTGSGLITLKAEQSTTGERSATLTVRFQGARAPLAWPVTQDSASPLATLNASVLQVPFAFVPALMELGIAGKFIAQQVAKVPEPFTLIALVIVEIIVVVVGLLAIVVRSALAPVVPEPKTWFGVPTGGFAEPYAPLTLVLPATAVYITEEISMLALYIAEQVVENG